MAEEQKEAGSEPRVLSASFTPDVARSWKGPVKFVDLAPKCCEAHGVKVRADRACFVLENVLSPEECAALVKASLEYHEKTAPAGPHVPGVRSQFSALDP